MKCMKKKKQKLSSVKINSRLDLIKTSISMKLMYTLSRKVMNIYTPAKQMKVLSK